MVTHYFPHVNAAVIKLKTPLSVGDKIRIKGHTTDFIQGISSMQVDRVPINTAKKGQEIGLLVDSRVRQHDIAYKA
ncbi:MAG: translation elongation factor-like protein [Candidatus Omnitrophica bacterium]|nr:translation elongation factor-like protein [Candidatus Omnitrophota bacterium]